MTLDKLNSQSLALFFSRHQKQVHLAIVVLLSLYLLAFAAKLIWRIIPEPAGPATPAGLTSQPERITSAQSGVDVAGLQQLNLFGTVNRTEQAADEQPVTDAPETKLNLTLTGVVVSSLKEEATAIIENRGTQNVYGLGEKIEGTNATLDQVMNDRVIIKNGIRRETLMLDGVDYDEANRQRTARADDKPRAAAPAPKRRIPPPPQNQVELDEDVASSLRESPADFMDFIAITPKIGDGQLVGYEIKPGKKPDLFQSAGLQAGDVVIQINGLDLTDTQQSKEAMSELRQADTIELTLTRDGEYITLYLEIPEAGND
ncbi:type II secretion system protein GspC [Alteromonas sp. RKMC-009]|uniref:type II secretion system protein GspC n=1 Tax=Alteromonas sp. RKMC-009 TaxID=2267264 RepID=UPI000E688B76|nr:type II secretion system protein GspC [Alteromonas sp. RKMC-009]AYA66258.1 type II secretion system protein GspC [Alteromonas sp. RKMC-009]